ncbi:hypothetical protein O9993_14520 [Vibrio lentus]|nr:hypothetical protein [Vibrio lentus]
MLSVYASNVRELEGALNRVIANANFTGRPITIGFVREALRVTYLPCKKTWSPLITFKRQSSEYYKIKALIHYLNVVLVLLFPRPRQLAMALAKS